ncbi:MAG TPA: sensory rhodopsin transducer [Bryobacteraceae bacterium]|nr:sensory rhodopsin transducer [Bryobacteraceae bacterium]
MIGRRQWAIAEGYIPPYSHGPAPQMVSHEAICILNSEDAEAHVDMMIFCVITSDVPIVVQHTRLDSRQAENALLGTIAFPGGD